MLKWLCPLLAAAISIILPSAAFAQAGTIPLSLSQVVDINGKPLSGCSLFIYQAGTVATPQNSYADFALTQVNPNPLTCDQFGRIPLFWLAPGLIHARLLDANGVQQVDVTMQVLGPSSGSGGGGSTVDPTTIATTGDIKFRMTAETVTGWVKLNGLTIGSATSGATGRANSDTQNLFIYLWTNCTNAHCAVPGGRGASGLADFNANKQITLPSWQDKVPAGRDCMDASCAGVLLSSNISSGGGDGVDTPGAFGGLANPVIAQGNLPNVNFTVSGSAPTTGTIQFNQASGGSIGSVAVSTVSPATGQITIGDGAPNLGTKTTLTTNITGAGVIAASGGSATPFGTISPFLLGTWYVKL